MNASRRVYLLLVSIIVVLLGAQRATAQCVSLTTIGSASTQNFDTLSNTAGSTTNNLTITGWFMTETGGGARDNEQYAVDTGGSNTGDTYSYGSTAATDRALGGLQSGTLIPVFGACFTNNTGATVTSLDVGYTGEEWRLGTAARTDQINFDFSTDATSLTTGAWTGVAALNFVTPVTATTGAKDGNAAANRTVIAPVGIPALSIANGATFWIRWTDTNASGADDGLAVDDFSLTPQGGGNAPVVPTCASPLTTTAGTATSGGVSATDTDGTVTSATITSITPVDPGTITLTGFTPAGGVGGTANATLSVSAATPANTYSVTIQWANNDGVPQTANCVVSVVVNPPPVIVFIHDVQGNGATTPIPGASVTIEGVVIGDFQPIPNDSRLSGFFVQEETTDMDAPAAGTSDGIFIFCGGCPTNVAEGQRVQVTGTVSEFFGSTQITATTAGSVVITNAGNNLAQVTASTIDLPVVAPVIDDFYEPMESMLVTYVDTLTVSEYFEQARYGRIELFEGGRSRQYTEVNPPNVAGYAAQLDNLNRRRVYLDDDDNVENSVLNLPNGQQFVFHPQANGGLSIGTQGTDFFRGGDTISSLTGILHYSFSGGSSPDEWRVRPVAASPAAFTAVNTRPATPPAVGGAIRVAAANVLNYFTTINSRGADSAAELDRQRDRTAIVICTLDADVVALMEIENGNAAIADLLDHPITGVNTRCGGANPYAFINTGGSLGTDQIRVILIYRTNIVSPVGSPISDMDAVHNRPPTAQTFDVVDATNPAFGERFTAVANHSKSKSCSGASGADLDQNDGQACFAPTRVAQHNRILTWVNGTVIPAAGDPDVLLLGDFNSYAQETATTTLTGGGYTDLETAFLGANAYSYLFDGQLGHLDYAFSSASLTPQVTGVNVWHINADENPLFDYNDEIDDGAFEQPFEEKPDGSALVPPRVLFQPASPYRASDHDPVLLGIFQIADLVVTKTDSPDPVNAGANLTYTITVTNNGPDAAPTSSWSDTLPAGTTFVSLPAVAGWSCTTPAVGATGTVTCNNPSFGVGSAIFTLTVAVDPSVAAGTVLSNTATATSAAAEGNPGDESDTETTTVATSADLQISKTDTPDPVNAGSNITYQITITNNGPSNAATTSFSDTLPAGTTFVSLSTTGSWSCTTPAVGANGTVSCTNPSFLTTVDFFTIVVNVDPSVAAGTVLSNTATLSSATSDPNTGNESDTATTTVAASADLSVTKSDTPDPVNAGANLTYTITVNNAGPSNATTVSLSDILPAETLFVSLASPGGWSCTTPGAFTNGTVSCTNPSIGLGNQVFTLVVNVLAATSSGTVINNSATVSAATTDPNTGNETGSAATTVATSANLSVTKTDSPDPVIAGNNITYSITITNAGPSNADAVSLSDTLPAGTTFVSFTSPLGWTCSTPAVGATGTVSCTKDSSQVAGTATPFTLVVNVDPSTAAGTVISNTITVASTTPDPTTGNESATATTTVAASADLSVSKVDTPDPVTAGNNLTYTITLNNAGPSVATNVDLDDTLPAGTTFVSLSSPGGWSCTTPAVGATGTVSCSNASVAIGNAVFTLIVNVDAGLANGTVITNTATASSTTTDPNTGNESGVATTTVGSGSADISVTKTDTPDPVTAGNNITYTITVNNAGPSNATTAALSDTLPAGTTFVSLSAPAGWSCATPAVGATGNVSCSIASLDVGSDVFTLTVAVNATVAGGSVITNTATASSATTDPNTGNESDTETTAVLSPATVTATKTASGSFEPGSTVTYTIVLSNSGPAGQSDNPGDEFIDVLPSELTLISANATSGTPVANVGTNTVTWNGVIPAGGSVTITIDALVEGDVPVGTTITNQGTVNSDADGNGINETSGVTDDPAQAGSGNATGFNVLPPAGAAVTGTKTVSGTFQPGTNVTYTIVLSNSGPANQADNPGNEFIDVLPAELTLISANATSGTAVATIGTNTVTWNGAIANGGSVTITIQALLEADAPIGSTVTNQGTINSDGDGNGTNETTGGTDDPGQGGANDGTTFVVGAASLAAIPVLDPLGLLALAALLGAIGLLVMRRL
ncbi:MAG: ExeM/NucH family extracellular endonuclease [Acidobacteriota bacterium]|nr:ExeM/NucH family extracellular endonuclease [Acidobacteriota bacterium]